MKKIIYLLALVLISSAAYGQKADFTGKWKINREKSQLGEQYSMAPNEMEIAQTDGLLTETRHSTFQGESRTYTNKYTLDGKPSENQGGRGGVRTSTAVWSEGNKVLTITTKSAGRDGGERTTTSIYRMKGVNLVIKSTSSSSRGERTETMVFDKE